MGSPVKQRLIEFIVSQGLSKNFFEKRCGLGKGFVNNIVNSIQPRTLARITQQFPELNTAWLLTGEGDMLKAANIAIDHSVAGNNNNVTMQTPGLIGKALDEIAAQRKLVERLVTMLEKVVEQLTSREEYNS